ncbi:MAG: hypothetical protein U9N81_11265, partial [Bacillota bacterium]|nr:hypothetical protein [Bacillota bacterium]
QYTYGKIKCRIQRHILLGANLGYGILICCVFVITGNLKLSPYIQKEKELQVDLHDYRVDVAEYQSCLLAAEMNHQDSYVEVLSDLIRHLDLIENRIITNINAKISELNTNRLTLFALMLSLSAVIMTAILVYINISINLLK